MKAGKLIVIAGSMFSGKSSELLRLCRRYVLAGGQSLYVKPVIDTRYSEAEVMTHDQDREAALQVENPIEIIEHINTLPYAPHVVGIDEGQFYNETMLLWVINKLLANGVDVVVAGLDMDRHGNPFGAMPHLMAIADHVDKLHAVCAHCGQDAYISYGDFEAGDQVVLGAADKYKPLCRTCWYKKTNP